MVRDLKLVFRVFCQFYSCKFTTFILKCSNGECWTLKFIPRSHFIRKNLEKISKNDAVTHWIEWKQQQFPTYSTPTTIFISSPPLLFIRPMIYYYVGVCPVFLVALCLSPFSLCLFPHFSLLRIFMLKRNLASDKSLPLLLLSINTYLFRSSI